MKSGPRLLPQMKSIRERDSQLCTEFQTHVKEPFPFPVKPTKAGCLIKRLLNITWMSSHIKVPVWWRGCSSRRGKIPKDLQSAPMTLRWRIIPARRRSGLLLTLCTWPEFVLQSPLLKHLFTSHCKGCCHLISRPFPPDYQWRSALLLSLREYHRPVLTISP